MMVVILANNEQRLAQLRTSDLASLIGDNILALFPNSSLLAFAEAVAFCFDFAPASWIFFDARNPPRLLKYGEELSFLMHSLQTGSFFFFNFSIFRFENALAGRISLHL